MKATKPVTIYKGPTRQASVLALDPTGLRLAAGDWSGAVTLWSHDDAKPRWSRGLGTGRVAFVAFAGGAVVAGVEGGDLVTLDAETGDARSACSNVALVNCHGAAHVQGALVVVSGQGPGWSGTTFLTLDGATRARVEDAWVTGAHDETVWLRHARVAARGGAVERIELRRCSLRSGEVEATADLGRFLPRAAHGPTGVMVGHALDDHSVAEFRALDEPPRVLGKVTVGSFDIAPWRFSPDGARVACSAAGTQPRVIDVRALTLTPVAGRHTKPVGDFAWSPDGATLYSAGWDRTVRAWRVGA